jgi:hypothetical protein
VRWIDLEGAVNVRDLGGLLTDDGRKTARRRLLRGDKASPQPTSSGSSMTSA